MKIAALFALVLAFVLGFGLIFNPEAIERRQIENAHRATMLHIEQQRAELELQEAQARASIRAAAIPVEYVLWGTLAFTVTAGAAVGIGRMSWNWHRRRLELLYPDAEGRLPWHLSDERAQAAALAALQAYHHTQATAAAVQPAPQHYAPHITTTTSPTLTLTYSPTRTTAPALALDKAEALEAEPEEADEPTGPSFEELIPEFGPGRPLVLGRDTESGELVRVGVTDLYNIGLGGTSGTGKSWTATALAAQHILGGGRLIIIDPHGRKPEGLTPRLAPFAPAFFCQPAIDLADVSDVVAMVRREVVARKEGKSGRPWLVIVDEYAALMRSSAGEAVGAMVEELGQEGRGFGLTALVSSQVWNGTRAGGSEVRDALASHIIHRIRPAQARMLTGLPADALPNDLYRLPKGHFYLLDTSGELRRVAAPRMSAQAVAQVAGLLTDAAPTMKQFTPTPEGGDEGGSATDAQRKRDGSATDAHASNAPQRIKLPSPEAAHAAALFLNKKSPAEIVYALRGVKSSEGGRRYERALQEVLELIREGVGTGHRSAE